MKPRLQTPIYKSPIIKMDFLDQHGIFGKSRTVEVEIKQVGVERLGRIMHEIVKVNGMKLYCPYFADRRNLIPTDGTDTVVLLP